MPLEWVDMTGLNRKWNDAWLSGLGAGVFGVGNVLQPGTPRSSLGVTCVSAAYKNQVLACAANPGGFGCGTVSASDVAYVTSRPVCAPSGGGGGGGGTTTGILRSVYNPITLQAQQLVNDLAEALNYSTIDEDGKLGPATCGALLFFTGREAAVDELARAPNEANALMLYLNAGGSDLGQACADQVDYAELKTPVSVGPLPPPPSSGEIDPGAGPIAPAPKQGPLNSAEIAYLQTVIAAEDTRRGRSPIAITGAYDHATCLSVMYYVQLAFEGQQINQLLQQVLANRGPDIADDCSKLPAMQQEPTHPTTPGGGFPPVPGSNACIILADGSSACDCERVAEGDTGPHIEHFQVELNRALVAQGYEPIDVSGEWDAATCGAQYELAGSFLYDPMTNPYCGLSDFNYPASCETMKTPKKTGETKMGMFAIGGLILAAGLGGAYWLTQR